MDQRRVLLAVVLSLGVVILYNELVVKPHQHQVQPVPAPPGEATAPTGSTLPPPQHAAKPVGIFLLW